MKTLEATRIANKLHFRTVQTRAREPALGISLFDADPRELSMQQEPRAVGAKQGEHKMTGAGFYTTMKIVGYVVMALMLVAIGYSAFIALKYWAGIGV